jgi:8-oxo-dGTP pyrophosphatase MutT (NUDIX family)
VGHQLFDDRISLRANLRGSRTDDQFTPGGGIGPEETWEQAAARECMEELGAEVVVGPAAYVAYQAEPPPGAIQRFYVARSTGTDPARRTGHEFAEPGRGTYETVHVSTNGPELDTLRPAELVPIVRQYGDYLASEARSLG